MPSLLHFLNLEATAIVRDQRVNGQLREPEFLILFVPKAVAKRGAAKRESPPTGSVCISRNVRGRMDRASIRVIPPTWPWKPRD